MGERDWLKGFDERQRKEIEFSKLYAETFHHGTDGHNSKMIIAKMAALLDEIEIRSRDLVNEVLSEKFPNDKMTISLAHRLAEVFNIKNES